MYRLHYFVFILTTSLFFTGCFSGGIKLDEPESISREKQIAEQEGRQEEFLSEIKEKYPEMNPESKSQAIRSILEMEGEGPIRVLGEIQLMESSKKDERKEERLEQIKEGLLKRDSLASVEVLTDGVRSGVYPLDERILGQVQKLNYKPAEALIMDHLEQGRLSEAGMDAMLALGNEDYVLSVASDPSHPSWDAAMARIHRLKSADVPRALWLSALKNATSLSDPGVRTALTLAEKSGEDPEIREILQDLYRQTNDPDLKQRLQEILAGQLDSGPEDEKDNPLFYQGKSMVWTASPETFLSRVTGEEIQQLASELEANRPGEGSENLTDKKARQPVPEAPRSYRSKSKTPIAAKSYRGFRSRKFSSSRAYRKTVSSLLAETMGASRGYSLEGRIHNALRSYSESDSSMSQFLIRSYRKNYKSDDASAVERMGRGLNEPGSLGAIVRNVQKEYRGSQMQTYVVTRMFDIPVWQAQLLMEVVRMHGL